MTVAELVVLVAYVAAQIAVGRVVWLLLTYPGFVGRFRALWTARRGGNLL